jgi:hypothetical protein
MKLVNRLVVFALAWGAFSAAGAVELQPETAAAFDHYIQLTEAELSQRMHPGNFLYMDKHPRDKSALWLGQPQVLPHKTLDKGQEIEIPLGLVQDWIGAMFLPGVTLDKVRAVLQDYPNYKNYFKPEVIESRLDKKEGDQYKIFLRLSKTQVLNVVLNTSYTVRYGTLDSTRMYVNSHSTRIAQVKNPRKKKYDQEETPGDDDGLLWRMNSYWRLQEADNGVYAELEAVSLSRDIPLGLGFLLKGFLEQFPRESMENTLQGLKQAVGVH